MLRLEDILKDIFNLPSDEFAEVDVDIIIAIIDALDPDRRADYLHRLRQLATTSSVDTKPS